MSKERELLKKIIKNMQYLHYECNKDLRVEIQELLAQPEQEPEQSNKWWYGKGVEDTKYFLTRKPLSDEVVRKFADAEYIVCNNAFIMGVRWAEAQHNIGVGDE